MRRRGVVVLVAALVAGLVVAGGPVLPAAAAEGAVTAFTIDKMDITYHVPYVPAVATERVSQRAYTDVTSLTPAAANGVRLVDAGGTEVSLAPPEGQRFVAGTSFPIGVEQSAIAGQYAPLAFCSANDAKGTGQATVVDAVYDGDILVSLAADVSWDCSWAPAHENLRSAVRLASTVPYTLVRSKVAGDDPRVPVGGAKAFSVTVDNAGTAPTTLGTATIQPDYGSYGAYAVTADGCAGTVLAPGASCSVEMTLTPKYASDGDWLGALLYVPVEGYPRTPGVPAALRGRVVPPPALPGYVDTVQGADGIVVLTRFHPRETGGTTSYDVVRRSGADEPWSVIGSIALPGTTLVLGHTDATLAVGDSAEYAVRAVGPLGVTAYSAPVATTRLTQETGDVDAIVVESDDPAVPPAVLDAADGATFTPHRGLLVATQGSRHVQIDVPYVDAPGVYPVHNQYVSSCSATGTLTVTTAVFDTVGGPVAYTADFVGVCRDRTAPVHFSVRYRSASPYRGVTAAQAPGEWVTGVNAPSERVVTMTARGSSPVTFGEASVAGDNAGDFQVVANGCAGQTLSNAGTCAITMRGTPAALGLRRTSLTIATDTALGHHTTPLVVRGATVPGTSYRIEAYPVVGRARVWWWESSNNGGTPLTAVRVYRGSPGGQWSLLATVPPRNDGYSQSYEDTTAVPGVAYAYSVALVNAVGEGPRLASPARYAPRNEVLFVHQADDSPRGLYVANERGNVMAYDPFRATFTAFADGTDVRTPAVSPDGRDVVYSAPGANGFGLWRRSFDGGEPVPLTTMAGDESDPAWSPDGRMIAFSHTSPTGALTVWAVPANGGKPVLRANGAADPAWQPDSATLVVADRSRTRQLLRIAPNGWRTPVPGSGHGAAPAVSPDGRWIAFTLWNGRYWNLAVLPLAGASAPRYVSSQSNTLEPQWARDGWRILHHSRHVSGLEVRMFVGQTGWNPASASNPFQILPPVTDSSRDLSATERVLGLHLTSAPHLTGPSASIGFAVTKPMPGETTSCSLDNATPVACTSPWRRSGLKSGSHTLVVRSTAPGHPVTYATHTWQVDATPPAVGFRLPAPVTLGSVVPVAFAATDAVSYDVRYRSAPPGRTYGAYVYPAAWQRTTVRSMSVAAGQGTEVCWSVRARDRWGNTSTWTADRCSTVAFDDRALGASAGWRRAPSPAAYLGTVTSTGSRAASLTRAGFTASRVYVVGTRCATCGAVDVWLGGVLLGRVSFAGASASQVVYGLPRRASPLSGTLRLTTVSSAPVHVDGVATLRM